MRRPLLAGACALSFVLLAAGIDTAPAATSPRTEGGAVTAEVADGTYVVLLRAKPTSLQTTATSRDLLADQDQVLASIGAPETLYRYTVAVNGFAAELTTHQVKQLQADPDVLAVSRDRMARLDRVTPAAGRAAVKSAASASAASSPAPAKRSTAGEGVVIGVIDSGIWPENPSFAAATIDEAEQRRQYPKFRGSCQTDAERWNAALCNGKVLAAQSYVEGFGASNIAAAEYLSPRDASGHGSHVAATAAGNDGVAVTIGRQSFGRISGVAPAAALAIYKACWAAPDPADDGCTSVDTVRAIDQAVSDGVDILNLSLSDADTSAVDPIEIALLNAADAGVFIAASAGDDGPARATVAHPGPWVTTVAASTGETYPGVVRLGDGTEVSGSMVSAKPVRSRRLVYAGAAPAIGADPGDAANCLAGSLDAAKVAGAIVVCDRGVNSRVAKGQVVGQAGAVAMILANTDRAPVEADIHEIPAVHVDTKSRRTIERYLNRADRPRAALAPIAAPPVKPGIADFSARGPIPSEDPDLIKPDLTATGVNVLAAASPPVDFGRLWDLSSGTSMAAAQVSGAAAIIRAEHPQWSPSVVKSALMTTAAPLQRDRSPLASGAGQLRVRKAIDPGLVYSASARSWWRYLRGQGVTAPDGTPVADQPLEGSNLNLASISIGGLVGEQQVTRRVTNVSGQRETYVADVSGLRGVATRVTPSTFTLAPGASRSFRIVFSARRSASYEAFTTGRLTWRGSNGHRVSTPMAIRPDTVRSLAAVAGSGQQGRLKLRADAGVTGTLATRVIGPVAADPVSLQLEPGSFDPSAPTPSRTAVQQSLDVPAGSTAARWEVTSDADVDLYAYRDGRLVATSSGRSGTEQITIDRPAAGSYELYVVAPDVGSSDAVAATLTAWALSDAEAAAGTIDVQPGQLEVTGTQRFALEVTWHRLDESRRYFAGITYAGSRSTTFVTIN